MTAITNPKDPEAFNLYMRGAENNDDALKASPRISSHSSTSSRELKTRHINSTRLTRRHFSHQSTWGSFTVEPVGGGSFIGSCFSSGQIKRRGGTGSHSSNHHAVTNHEGTPIPEFGAWDVTDPKSGEGYTAMFNEIRKEKELESRRIPIPSNALSLNNCSNIQSQCGRPSSILSKFCCCLFSSERK